MKKILLLSDTHGHIDEAMLRHVHEADEVWHAGDWGPHVADTIAALKPLKGVYGNIDDQDIRLDFPLHNRFRCEDLDVWITHIGGYPGRYTPGLLPQLKASTPDLFISGHSHVLKVMRDPQLGLLHMNPGAAGIYGFHKVRTMLRFRVDGKTISEVAAIELGLRGALPK